MRRLHQLASGRTLGRLDVLGLRDASPPPTCPDSPSCTGATTPHGDSLARMRTWLAASDSQPLAIRSLAQPGTDDPAVALLDAWAVVADVVSFYTERIAQEGFLRTATERDSVRQQARTLGYELRPGVAAQVELAFTWRGRRAAGGRRRAGRHAGADRAGTGRAAADLRGPRPSSRRRGE